MPQRLCAASRKRTARRAIRRTVIGAVRLLLRRVAYVWRCRSCDYPVSRNSKAARGTPKFVASTSRDGRSARDAYEVCRTRPITWKIDRRWDVTVVRYLAPNTSFSHGGPLMMRSFHLLVLLGALAAMRSASAATIAEYDPVAPPYSFGMGVGNPSFVRGQSFTAAISGNAAAVQVYVMRDQSATGTEDLLVELRTGALLTNPLLATATIPYSAVPAGDPVLLGINSNATFVGANLVAPVALSAASTYSIWLKTTGTSDLYGWWGNGGDAYTGGAALTNDVILTPAEDVGFRVLTTRVPEPSTFALALCAAMGLLALGQRFGRRFDRVDRPRAA